MLVKRSFATLDHPIDEQCELEEDFNSIYVKEEDWYDLEIANASKKKK
jgi:hypothetical protein